MSFEGIELPGGLKADTLYGGIEELLQNESWDVLTLKVVVARLEASLLPQHAPGTLKPFKKILKEVVDVQMKAILKAKEGARMDGQHQSIGHSMMVHSQTMAVAMFMASFRATTHKDEI